MAGAAGAAPDPKPAMADAGTAVCELAAEALEVAAAAGGAADTAGMVAAAPGNGEGPRDAVLARLLVAAAPPLVVFTDTWSVSCLQGICERGQMCVLAAGTERGYERQRQ